jgi:MinD superfamily P-loop ATPase
MRINSENCTRCGLCEKSCKSSCIDSKNGTIDATRCVVCLNCAETCRYDAIAYSGPGASGLRNYSSKCADCQLCVSNCPNQALISSDRGAGAPRC